MRRVLPVFLIILLLCGCAERKFETVRDALPTADPADAPMEIRVSVPADAVETSHTADARVYTSPDGGYTITTRVLVSDGLDAAVYAVCGFLQPRIELDADGGRECRLAWCADGAVYRARIRMAGDFCYVLCLRLRAGLGGEYNEMINELFSSFSLVPK